MTWLVFPDRPLDAETCGGKAAALSRLAQAGFAPPAFCVLRPEAFTMGDKAPQPAHGLQEALAEALAEALPRIGPGPYAVRSSGRAEDGSAHSHAGQFDTVLNVAGNDVPEAAARVWASGFGAGLAEYRARTGGGAAEAPAIVVQQMIDARASGVAFSADPVSGRRDLVVISAISGLGEALVSGEVDGEDWTLDAAAIRSAPASPEVLTPSDARHIAALARRAEAHFGAPQDIEWAFDAKGLHILQSRPITTALRPAPLPDSTLTILDNSNIVESYPGLVSPLTYSFAVHVYSRVYRAFVRLLGVRNPVIAAHGPVFDNMLSRVDGRVYYNLVNWYRALALLPGFSLNRDHMETMMGVDTPMPREITDAIGPGDATGLDRLREYARLAPVVLGLLWQAIRLPRTRRGFYARLNAALEGGFDPARANGSDAAAEYRRIEANLLDRWDAPLVNDFLCMMAFGASRKLLERWLGAAGLALHNDVMIGQGDIISAEPARRIAEMGAMARTAGLGAALRAGDAADLARDPALKRAFDAYIAKFGDRCTEELKLESIPLSEDATALVQAIAASAARPPGAGGSAPRHAPDYATLFKGKPVKKALAKAVIGWTKARVRDRENLRFERTRVFGHARRVFLVMGRELTARGHLDDAREIFYLTTTEALAAIEGAGLSPDLRGLVALRRSDMEAAAARQDPPARIEIRGPAIAPVWGQETVALSDGRARRGTGCSAGQVQARARVIRDPRTEALSPGDILVARHTDPGWIAVFSNASAIVVERGSLLSHSAIVARELGIPCVVGLKGATNWVRDGETLKVNGANGEVERVDVQE